MFRPQQHRVVSGGIRMAYGISSQQLLKVTWNPKPDITWPMFSGPGPGNEYHFYPERTLVLWVTHLVCCHSKGEWSTGLIRAQQSTCKGSEPGFGVVKRRGRRECPLAFPVPSPPPYSLYRHCRFVFLLK